MQWWPGLVLPQGGLPLNACGPKRKIHWNKENLGNSETHLCGNCHLSCEEAFGGKLQIRCRFKTANQFVVRDFEWDLCNLDNEWDHVNIQTSKKLRHVVNC